MISKTLELTVEQLVELGEVFSRLNSVSQGFLNLLDEIEAGALLREEEENWTQVSDILGVDLKNLYLDYK